MNRSLFNISIYGLIRTNSAKVKEFDRSVFSQCLCTIFFIAGTESKVAYIAWDEDGIWAITWWGVASI